MYSGAMLRRLRHARALILFAMVSCGMNNAADSSAVEPPPKTGDTRPLPPPKPDPELQPLVDAARTDLVERLAARQIGDTDLKTLAAQRVTWRSAALGCPMPDRAYQMVLVPGVLIRLLAAGETYEYHSTLRGPPFLCEAPGRIETPAPGGDARDPT
jgi:hypothetical protein